MEKVLNDIDLPIFLFTKKKYDYDYFISFYYIY